MKTKRSALVAGFALLVIVITGTVSVVYAQYGGPNGVLSPASSLPVIEVQIPDKGIESLPSGWYGYTVNAGSLKGEVTVCAYSSTIKSSSFVLVEASEGYYNNRHLGSAKITVNNVVPIGGQVCAWVTVNWSNPIPLAVDFIWTNR